jgi:hypothetical protein
MARPATVKSIDALQTMSASLTCFREDAAAAIDELEMEIRRALQWIGQDCREYWKAEVRRSRDKHTEARLQLEHAQMFRKVSEERASCIEEKKALEQAKRRLQEAESKVQAIAHWVVVVEKAVNEYRGSRSQFATWLEVDFPKAVASLSRMIASLETYVRIETPEGGYAPQVQTEATSTAEEKPADAMENPEPRTPNPENS